MKLAIYRCTEITCIFTASFHFLLPSFRFHLRQVRFHISISMKPEAVYGLWWYSWFLLCVFLVSISFTFLKIQKYITSAVIQGKHLHISLSVIFIVTLLYFTWVTRIETQNSSKHYQTKREIGEDSCMMQKHTRRLFSIMGQVFFSFLFFFKTGSGPLLCILYRVTLVAAYRILLCFILVTLYNIHAMQQTLQHWKQLEI